MRLEHMARPGMRFCRMCKSHVGALAPICRSMYMYMLVCMCERDAHKAAPVCRNGHEMPQPCSHLRCLDRQLQQRSET